MSDHPQPGDVVRFPRRCVPGVVCGGRPTKEAYEYEVEIHRHGLIIAVMTLRDAASVGSVYIVLFSGTRFGWFAPSEIAVLPQEGTPCASLR